MTDALAHLRANHEGTLLADALANPVRVVYHKGRVVFPAFPAILEAENLILVLPQEDDEDELQLMLAAAVDDAGGGPDRWRAYHGEPALSRWVSCTIEGTRFQGQVVDHEPLNATNPLAVAEPALCRTLNAQRPRLALVRKLIAGVAPQDPLAVGVDDLGIDIRARFGIIRLPFREPAPTAAQAESRIASLFGAHP